jgi:hypothetical protein
MGSLLQEPINIFAFVSLTHKGYEFIATNIDELLIAVKNPEYMNKIEHKFFVQSRFTI